jgi:hypothetical protein
MAQKFRAFRVTFYVDRDYNVEHFAETVILRELPNEKWGILSRALSKAIKQARKDGGTNSGREMRDYEWSSACEIDTFEFPYAYALELRRQQRDHAAKAKAAFEAAELAAQS